MKPLFVIKNAYFDVLESSTKSVVSERFKGIQWVSGRNSESYGDSLLVGSHNSGFRTMNLKNIKSNHQYETRIPIMEKQAIRDFLITL